MALTLYPDLSKGCLKGHAFQLKSVCREIKYCQIHSVSVLFFNNLLKANLHWKLIFSITNKALSANEKKKKKTTVSTPVAYTINIPQYPILEQERKVEAGFLQWL